MNGDNDARSAALPPDVRKVSDLPRGESIFSVGLCWPDGRSETFRTSGGAAAKTK